MGESDMVNVSHVREDVKNMAQRHNIAFFDAADLFNEDVDTIFHYDYPKVLKELRKKDPDTDGYPILLPTFFGEYVVDMWKANIKGYYSPRQNAFLSKDKLSLSTYYHETAHALQTEKDLFNDCNNKTYKSYLEEMHSECFAFAALMLQAENPIDFVRQAHFAYKRGLTMTNEALDKDGSKLYASLPVMKETIKQVWKHRQNKASFFRKDGGLDEYYLSQFALDIVKRSAYSEKWFENFSKKHKERYKKYKFLLNKKLLLSQEILAIIFPPIFRKKSDFTAFYKRTDKLERHNKEILAKIEDLVRRAFNNFSDYTNYTKTGSDYLNLYGFANSLYSQKLHSLHEKQQSLWYNIFKHPSNDNKDYYAVKEANTQKSLKKLLKSGIDIDTIDVLGYTALMDAENLEKTILLTNNGADPFRTSKQGMTTLMTARTAEQTRFLLNLGLDVNAQDGFGFTALMLAKTAKQAKVLLNAGADITIKNIHGESAIEYISKSKQVSDKERKKILRVLENYNSSNQKKSLFNSACQKLSNLYDNMNFGYCKYKRKVKAGLIALAVTAAGTSFAVHQKMEHNHEQRVIEIEATLSPHKFVLSHFKNFFDIDKIARDVNATFFGITPLSGCMRYNEPLTAKKLIELGADVNARNDDGSTALMWANSVEQAKLLLDAGADVNARNNEGLTVMEYFEDKVSKDFDLTASKVLYFLEEYTHHEQKSDNTRSRIEQNKAQYKKVSDGLRRTKHHLEQKNMENDVSNKPQIKGKYHHSLDYYKSSENERS